jgi:uncharacterized protein YabN with tetrapyrrole methylase and pyrophosphatase domain
MKKFDELLEVATRLNGPKGCPWDQKQTFLTLQPYVLEEAHEVIEAVDSGDDRKIVEELGDLLYTIVFYAKVGERENRFIMEDVIESIREKLIRRHPHVFGDVKVNQMEEIVTRWEAIKKEEKGHEERKSVLDGIPKTLPQLLKAQKILKRIRRTQSSLLPEKSSEPLSEESVGKKLLDLILQATDADIDGESALRRALQELEETFRKQEQLA